MFQEELRRFWLGKSQLKLREDTGVYLQDKTEVQYYMNKFGNQRNYYISPNDLEHISKTTDLNSPDWWIVGNYREEEKEFISNPHGPHILLLTGVNLEEKLSKCRCPIWDKVLWSSYYQDHNRGYLFQIYPKSFFTIKTK